MKMKESVTEEQKLELYHLLKDRYLIGDLLKKGEHSRIYRAYDTVLDQEITIKEFVPENPDMAETDTGNFIEEAGKFFGVYEYQGIAEVTDVFRDGEHAYMAIEYLPGKNLREYLNAEKKGQITIEEAWTLLFPVLDTVSWMHSNGMVHGGIRMSRLIFDENDRLCLTGIGDCFLRNRGKWSVDGCKSRVRNPVRMSYRQVSIAGRMSLEQKENQISQYLDYRQQQGR